MLKRLSILIGISILSFGLAQNIVSSVAKAPIDPTGDVAGRTFDIIILLDRPMSPHFEGRSLAAGKTIKVELPEAMILEDTEVFSAPTKCGEVEGVCNLGIIVQGWPQKPIPFSKFDVSFEEPRTVVIKALENIGPGAAGPGIKVIHLNLPGVKNPEAGSYELKVMAETGPNGSLEEGVGVFTVLAETKPSINVTSTLSDAPGTNLIHQQTEAGKETPLPFDFLLWDAAGAPMLGVSVSDDGRALVQNGLTIGSIDWTTPEGASGHKVFSKQMSTEVVAPPSTFPAGHLRVYTQSGGQPGHYAVTFTLNDGTSQTMHVFASDPNLGSSHAFTKLDPSTSDSNGNNILVNCGEDYPNATARMMVNQDSNQTDVDIMVSGARPNTLFTIWLWLKGTDAQGNSFGGNPLSGKSGAPMAPSTAFAELREATGSDNGVTEGANVFTTDANGNATFSTTLDFPLFGGAYPFHKIEGFDPADDRFSDNARLYPVALVTSDASYNAPFMVRIASHCKDGLSHGWAAGEREPWFDFPR